ncbi:histidine kinase [Xenophilus arseniciresistens]|uniref:Histidine kinase n=1 Tax=Xenophilus arseniciresistens TaxID=1283306 RepID=A0AAE3NAY0_9BURK|nr:MHYT domain-containing protein [Xenophilus arseniciresistens]MDA7416952.1 histidine kinase [Xenophilus arseniciresistens]
MELQVGQILNPRYGMSMVALSFVMACAGSFVALLCARRMFRTTGQLDWPMAVGAAVALGGIGIWSMHFIGMVAYSLPVRVSYDIGLTLVSLVAAVLISGLALYLAGRGRNRFNRQGWAAGSLLAGLGVCVMHYMGMFAMNMRATMEFDTGRVAMSVLIAVTAAAAALWLAFHLRKTLHQAVAALVMGLAVCSMHYVGMSAATMVCTAAAPANSFTIGGSSLGLMVFGLAGAVLLGIGYLMAERSIAHAREGTQDSLFGRLTAGPTQRR